MVTWVLDISNWQGNFNIGRAVGEGYSAVVCKATEGRTFKDGRFDSFIPAIKAAGAIPGGYHYLRAGDGAAQAQAFHDRITAHGGPNGWLIQLDNEADATWDTTVAWANEWRRLTGGHPFLMYTGGWWWKPRGWPGATLTPYLWHSRYVDGSDFGSKLYEKVSDSWWAPGYGGWSTATILQFSSTGNVAGQKVDVNAFRGSVDDLRGLTHGGSTRPTGPAPVGPSWPGRHLRYTPGQAMPHGEDVRVWQIRMRERGWRIGVDGSYGPESAGVCRRFQADKHLGVDGIVGPVTWAAAWNTPVT